MRPARSRPNVATGHVHEGRDRSQTYHRRFRFPKEVDEDAIEAADTNGVLEVHLPANDATRGTAIPIEG